MTRMTPLLERNEQFARTCNPAALGIPARQVLIVTCLDHRVDPAVILGLQLGDAPVIRNAGGRVTQAVIDDSRRGGTPRSPGNWPASRPPCRMRAARAYTNMSITAAARRPDRPRARPRPGCWPRP